MNRKEQLLYNCVASLNATVLNDMATAFEATGVPNSLERYWSEP